MSEEIICISSDDEDTCIESLTETGITSISCAKNTEYQLYTYQSEAGRNKQITNMCTCYEQKVRNAQDKVSVKEKYAEKVKLQIEESQKNLLNLLANPAYSHLEDIIQTAIHIEKNRYTLLLKEVFYSKQQLKQLEKRLAVHKNHLKMLMQTKNS